MPNTSKKAPRSFSGRLKSFVSSESWFRLLVIFFALEALWIALSGRYPMAFDENFHLGIIKLYAHHISPFWSGNSPGSGAFGPVAQDPSYLYQWLMSFPYRLINAITSSQTAQIVVLRLINIALFAAGLPLYRRLLLKTGASRAIIHFCLALFVLIPIAPLLAAQINYDNLFFPLTALALLWTIDFGEKLRRGRFDMRRLLGLAVVVMLNCLVKYAFLPIALVVAGYLLVRLRQTYESPGKLSGDIKKAWIGMSVRSRWLLVSLLVLSFGLFAQRYLVNLVRYHTPVPSCEQVLTTKECSIYGPWARDYSYAHTKPAGATSNPLVFDADWFYGMWFRTFFAVDGPATDFMTRGPLIMPSVGAIVFSVSALAATLISWREMTKRYEKSVIWLFVAVMAVYAAALWVDGYRSFLQTGQPVAINGRYLLVAYPLLMVILALGANTYLRSRVHLKMAIAGMALLCMFWGGGALTYILRSNDAWYLQNTPMKSANHAVQNVVGPLVPGNDTPRSFMGRHGT